LGKIAFVNKDNWKNVPRETLGKLFTYEGLLRKWNEKTNLVSRGTLSDVWKRHFLDSWQIVSYVKGPTVLDVGTGAGFPGMVLAMGGGLSVTCVDSERRKILFLEEVARQTHTTVQLVADMVESLGAKQYQTVCARGFAALPKLLELTERFSNIGYGVFLKGRRITEEIREAENMFAFSYQIYPSLTDPTGQILVVDGVKCKE
jgi:16S rRNA (guanine527-N7)-methyltransferase